MQRPNLILVISDTLRLDYLGCYGSSSTKTPNIDAFARQAVRFNRAFPEALPTIPVRRALHTGRRTYPFRDYAPLKWDIVYLPGWQPMSNDEDTLAESLAEAGYHTGFVTDTLPYFAPGLNFTRGFWQWEYIRGQQQDRWKSPYSVPAETLSRYGVTLSGHPGDRKALQGLVPMHLANTQGARREEDTSTAKTFQWAMDFLRDNRDAQPFYLLVDCFDPHEPWEAPEDLFAMYHDTEYAGRRIVHCGYGPAETFGYTQEEIEYVKSHYSGLVTLVDKWFGKLMDRLEAEGLADDTVVILTSDHGTNFCDNPRGIIGKPDDAMYPGVMRLPLLAKLPGGVLGGTVRDELVYNIDITATLYELAGMPNGGSNRLDGQSLVPLLTADGRGWEPREYVTCLYNSSLCYIDDRSWVLADIDGRRKEVFDLEHDPLCSNDLSADDEGRFELAWRRLLQDAGGAFPDYRTTKRTDAIGELTSR